MKLKFMLLGLVISLTGFSQGLSDSARGEILSTVDNEVWIPFISALSANDSEAYRKVHSKRMLRVSNDRGGKLWVGEDYFDYTRSNFDRIIKNGIDQKIEIGFSERTVSETVVSDRGFYKYTYSTNGNTPKVIYGQFHLISHLEEDGKWRFVLDYDFTDQEKIFEVSEKAFNKSEKLKI